MTDATSEDFLPPGPAVRVAASRWASVLLEALTPTADRMGIEADFKAAHAANPSWTDTWFAGCITSIMASLPSEDPWRNLSANYVNRHGRAHHVQAPGVPPMETTGARTKGREFGSRRDHTDLVQPSFNDWQSDLGLAAVSRPASPASNAIIGAAGRGDWKLTRDLLREIRIDYESAQNDALTVASILASSTNDYEPMLDLFGIYRDALVFPLHRRRVYVGRDDDYSWATMFRWITRTDRILAGEEYLASEFDLDNAEGKVLDGEYKRFRMGST